MSLFWSKPQRRMPPDATTDTGVSICAFNNKLHMVWRAAGSSNTAIKHSIFDGCYWTATTTIPGAETTTVPSLATASLQGGPTRLYMAWRHPNQSQWLISYSDTSGWDDSPPQAIPNASSTHGPSLASFNNKLWAAWKGSNNDMTMWRASFDGSNWSTQQPFPTNLTSSASPTLCTFKGRLYIFWKWAATPQMSRMYTTNGTTWSTATPLNNTLSTRTGPAAAAVALPNASYMYVFWDEANNQIHYTATADGNHFGFGEGTSFEESLPAAFATSTRPAVAVWNGIVWVAWRNDDDNSIWCTSGNY